MIRDIEDRTRHFYRWERRGRGYATYPYPVSLEPPFIPFRFLRASQAEDDGRHHSALSGFLERLTGKREAPEPPTLALEEPNSIPVEESEELVEFALRPSRDGAVGISAAALWLGSLASLDSPFSLELVGTRGRVELLMSARESATPILSSQLGAFFPTIVQEFGKELLIRAWEEGVQGAFTVVEFGLAREFMLPLNLPRSFSPDPLTPLVAALAEAQAGEVSLIQILFQGVEAPWPESTLRAVTTPSGVPFFANAPEFSRRAAEKVKSPLFAVLVRAAVRARSEERLWSLFRAAASGLSAATRGENELIPLGGGVSFDLFQDLFLRTTHRHGALLSLPELLALVHPPDASVRQILREVARTKVLPAEAEASGIFLGYNRDHGEKREVRLPAEARMRHVHVIGASGTGKSTLLVSMIREDIAEGRGVGVIDPHGDLVDEVLGEIPESRREDVILFDPADPGYVVGWNILSASSEPEREMLASDLVAAFERLSTSWGDQMTAVLANAVLAFLDSSEGGTLSDLRRFLAEESFRRKFLQTVRDPYIRSFWETEFTHITGKPHGSILTRLDTLLRNRLVRGAVTAREKPLDFREVVDQGRIFLARLSQGAIGEENAALLGSLLVSKIHQVSLLRQDQTERERRPFFLYLDEFHHLATPSMAALFSGARKYRLGVTVAHQDLYQLRSVAPEVERSVLANAYTRITFSVSDEDARTLSKTLSYFSAEDLGNLGTGEAVVRLGRREQDFNLETLPIKQDREAETRRKEIREQALTRWGVPRREEIVLPVSVPGRQGVPPRATVEEREVEVKAETEASQPERAVRPAPPETRRPGKGGPEHTYLQELVKRFAEERGFRAAVEEQIAGSRESVDVALYRGETRIACEISVTTPLEYEVGNVEKCLAAGFGTVAVVSLKKARLTKLEKLLDEAIPPEERAKVHLFTTEELFSWLEGQPVFEEVETVRGYKVKVRYKNPGDDRHKRVAEILARSIQGLKKDK